MKARSERKEAKRREIIEAAKRLLHQKGYYGTSMSDIAVEVGLVKASLYQHIDSKEDMVCEIMFEGLNGIVEDLEQAASKGCTYDEKLRLAIKHHIWYTTSHTDILAVLLENTKHLPDGRRAEVVAEQHRYEEVFQDILEGGIRNGEFSQIDSKVVTFAILGMVNWVYRWYSDDGALSQDEIAEIFYNLVLPGLRNPVPSH